MEKYVGSAKKKCDNKYKHRNIMEKTEQDYKTRLVGRTKVI